MRLTLVALASAASALVAGLPAHAAKPTAQSASCARKATEDGLKGAERTAFLKTCQKGTAVPAGPTGPTATSKESQAVTKPSGVDRTVRSAQCNKEADRRGLSSQQRNAFRLSCLATAGPVTEGETGTQQPKPANQIKGIGENNYKPSAANAKSTSAKNAPEAIKPK